VLRIAKAVCTGGMLVVATCAIPALASPPLVDPRTTKPDSVRALERARADSVRAVQPHLSGGHALAIGLATTLALPATSLLANPPGSSSEIAWEASLTICTAVGLYLGPAIGLSSGGRDDLAKRGLLIRGFGYGATLIGLLAVGSSLESSSYGAGIEVVALVGLLGAGASVVSAAYDLAITPSAVGPARHVSLRPVVDERGRLALRARF